MKGHARRAVPLDEDAYLALCPRVVDALAAMCAKLPPLTNLHPAAVDRFMGRVIALDNVHAPELRNIATVRGDPLDISLLAEIVFRPKAQLVLGTSTIRFHRSSWVEVRIQWNAAHTEETAELAEAPGLYEHRVCGILRHELTHAHDVVRERDVVAPVGLGGDPSRRAYFNSPHEVRAFMAQVLDEVTRPGVVRLAMRHAAVSRTPNLTLVEAALEHSPTWLRLADVWTDANKKHVLKNVAQALAPYTHAYPKPPLR